MSMTDDFSEQFPNQLSDLPYPPEDPFERAAMRRRRAVLGGRDAPDLNTDAPTLASIGAGIVPLSGYADIAGYMPDFRGGYEPSLLENLKQGNYGTGALQVAGIIPGVGAVRKAVRATAGARRLATRVRIFDNSIRRAESEVAQTELARQSPAHISNELANLFAKEGLEEKMLKVIEDGRKMGATNWYNTEPLRQVFIKELGPGEGEKAFRKYMGYVAATSAASDVGSNARNASYYFGLDLREGRLPEIGERMERPYGHYASRNHQIFAQKVRNDELDPLVYQKLRSFFENLTGNYAPVTVDRHALRLPAMLAGDSNFLTPKYKELFDNGKISMEKLGEMPSAWRAPIAKEYAALEQFYKGLARKAGFTPAETQAAAWVGGSARTGVQDNGLLSFIDHFEDRLHLAADKLGLPVAEVLRQFVRGKVNLSSLEGQENGVA